MATAHALTALGPRITRWGSPPPRCRPPRAGRPGGRARRGRDHLAGRRNSHGLAGTERTAGRDPAGRDTFTVVVPLAPIPPAELATSGLDRLHRQRVVDVSIQGFLHDLGHELDGDDAGTQAIGSGARSFDDRPLFLHHLEDLDVTPDDARRWLLADLDQLATAATTVAVSHADAALEAGQFRATARPRVTTRPARADEPPTVWIRWVSDEEATGWPCAVRLR